ncbi:hypothetical protein, partial [Bacillus sp. JJ722]|uniref:hypothetical protein n=1 Tax=Bacillus sp. JJ722 TaxID=3122973 RepID=UPI0030006C5D
WNRVKTKLLSIFLLFIFCINLSACQLPQKDKILEEEAEYQTIPVSKNGLKMSIQNVDLKAKEIEIKIENNYSYDYSYGLYFRILKKR